MRTFDEKRTDPSRALQIWQVLIAKADSAQTVTYEQLAKVVSV